MRTVPEVISSFLVQVVEVPFKVKSVRQHFLFIYKRGPPPFLFDCADADADADVGVYSQDCTHCWL